MFEKIGRLAETAATEVSVSRRGFLGRLGHVALTAAAGLGGLLALSNKARAGRNLYQCSYQQKKFGKGCQYISCLVGDGPHCGGCPEFYCCKLISKTIIGTC
jgi:hypothetical protein